MNNNPVRFNDPSGHDPWYCETAECEAQYVREPEPGSWNDPEYSEWYSRKHACAMCHYAKDSQFTVLSNEQWADADHNARVAGVQGGAAMIAGAAIAAIGVEVTAAFACGDGDCGNEATSVARTLGQLGEKAAGIVKNTTRIPSLTNTAAYRIPDQLIPEIKLLSEVKNVGNLSLTSQIQDYVAFAQQNGYTFELFTRATTTFSEPLQNLINNGQIVPKVIP